ncbi:hypothetical protein H312_03493, partial [Anncaliia algerae PRA339]
MNTAFQLEKGFYKMNQEEVIEYLMSNKYLKKEIYCQKCGVPLVLVKNKRSQDKYSWRCMFKTCLVYKKYFSLREGSFFRDFKIDLKSVMLIIIKYSCRQQKYQINQSMDYAVKTIKKVIDKLVDLMPQTDFSSNKLG